MVPDLAFILRMRDDSVFSHTLAAQAYFTIPATMILVWLSTAMVGPAILPYLRNHSAWQVHDLAALQRPRSWRAWTSVAMSGCVGGLSHVFLDGITHGNHSGWLVPWFPFLRTSVPHFGGSIPLHDFLQLWLTVVFGVASALMWRWIARRRLLWRWRRRERMQLPRLPRRAGQRLAALCLVAAATGAVVGASLHRHDAVKTLAAGTFFGAIDFVLGALVLAAIAIRVDAQRRVGVARSYAARQGLP